VAKGVEGILLLDHWSCSYYM